MHEFSAVNKVLEDLKNNPRNISVKLGCMQANKEVLLSTLKEMIKGTNLENLTINVIEIKAEGKCNCGFTGPIKIPGHIHFLRCPECNEICEIIKGNELIIEDLKQ